MTRPPNIFITHHRNIDMDTRLSRLTTRSVNETNEKNAANESSISAAASPAAKVRPARWRDQFAICGLECACFGAARLAFGLWPRVGSKRTQAWLAEVGDNTDRQAAGYLIAYPWPLDGQPLTYIGGVGVKQSHRQQGIGEHLTRQVLAANKTVWLHVREHNRSAIHLYDKLGFQVLKPLSHFYSNGDHALVMLHSSNSQI